MSSPRILSRGIVTLMTAAAMEASAANLTWDANAAADPSPYDGAGVWDLTAARWWDGFGSITWNNSNDDIAVFGASTTVPSGVAGAVSFTVALSAGGLEFQPYIGNGVKYNLSGGTGGSLTLTGAAPTIMMNTAWVRPFAAINGVLGGTSGLTLGGSGILEFGTQTNTLSGGITIRSGALSIANDAALGGTGNSFTFSGDGTLVARTGFTMAASRGIMLNAGATGTLEALAGQTWNVPGVISGTGHFQKDGLGGITLSGVNTYTGETRVRQGTLTLNFADAAAPGSNIINNASPLRLYGGTLAIAGKAGASNIQGFNGLTLDPGHSGLSSTVGASGTTSVSLGRLARNTGGTLNVSTITVGSSYNTTNNAINGIVGGFATVNHADWLAVDGNGNLGPLGTYQTGIDPAAWGAGENVALAGNPSAAVAGNIEINSLKLTGASAIVISQGNSLTLGTGGLLITAGTASIGGGTLKGAAGADLVVHQHHLTNAATISSVIADNNAATALTKTGAGALILGGLNSYSGNTFVNAGVIEISSDANLGVGKTVTLRNGTTLRISGTAPFASTKDFQFDLGSDTFGGVALGANGSGANFIVEVTNPAGALIAGAFDVTAGTMQKTGAGTVTLTHPGVNHLARLNGGLAFHVSNGGIVLDGGPSSEWNVGQGEVTIGDTNANVASITLKSGTFNNGSFTSIGRGNGTTGLSSSLNVTGGTWNTGNLFTGFGAGVANYNAKPVINVSGNGIINISGGLRLSEQAGESVVNLSGNGALNLNEVADIGYGSSVAGTRAIIHISDNAIFALPLLNLGRGTNVVGSTAAGVINQSGGTVMQHGFLAPGDWRIGGLTSANDALVYGAYHMMGGTLNTGTRNFQIGAYGRGLLDVRGGAEVNSGAFPVVGRFAGGIGVLNVGNGSFNATGTGNLFIIGEAGTGIVNLGTAAALTVAGGAGAAGNAGGTGGIRLGHVAGGSGILNVNGGTVTTTGIARSSGTGSAFLYLNGGAIRATISNPAFLQGLNHVVIGPDGVTFDTGFNDITVAQPLATPGGSGITAVPLATGGAGYIGQPIVQITGGGGVGATAVANVSGGIITGITITNPGINYTSLPTITLLGGGATTPATLNGAGVLVGANNPTGGLTKTGAGKLTLSGANEYGGPTAVNEGTLLVTGSTTGTGPVSVGGGATLGGTGSMAGMVTINAGGLIAPGADGIGTLTLGGLTLGAGAFLDYEVSSATTRDLINVTGGITLNGGSFRLYEPGTTTAYKTNGVYNLISYSGAIGGSGIAALAVDPGARAANKSYGFGAHDGFITLTISTAGGVANFWNKDADGSWITGGNWSEGAAPNGVSAFANFGGGGVLLSGPRTVTLGTVQTVGSIGFNSAQPYTLTGTGSLLLNNGIDPVTQITNTNGSHVIGVALAAVSPTTQFSVANAADTLTFSGALSGATEMRKIGAGTLAFTGANSYAGATVVGEGTLLLSGAGTLGNPSNPLSIIKANVDLGGTSQATGAVTIAGGTLGNGTLTPSALTVSGTEPTTVSAVLAGSTGIEKFDAGLLTLSGNNSYTGATVIHGGTLAISSLNALGNPTNTLQFNEGVLQIDGKAVSSLGSHLLEGFPTAVNVTDATHAFGLAEVATFNALVKQGEGKLVLGGTNSFSSSISSSVRAGSLTIAADGKVTAADLGNDIGIEVAPANGSNATLNVEPGATLQTQRLILGGNTANNSGGSATLNQTGGTIHSGQWLAVGSAGTGTSVMNLSGGILNVNGSGGTHMEVAVFGAANGVVNVSGSAEIHVLNNGNLQMGQAANGSGNGTINQTGGTVTFHSDGGMTPGGIGGLRLGNGTGRTGTYTYNLAGGSLTVPVITRNSGTAVFNFDGGTLRAADSNPTFLSGLIATHIKGGGAMVDSNGFDVTIATTLAHDATLGAAPDGGLVKQGAGTLTLSGANSYTGATVVEAGTLLLSGGISGSRSIQVKQDATLDVSTVAGGFFLVGGQTLAGSGLVSGSLGMNANSRLAPGDGIGTLAFANNLTISLAVTPVASSALQFQLGGPEASDRITLASGTLTIGNGVLGLDDLALLPQQGFGAGTYLLVDGTVPITGFLDLNAANLNGNIQGFEANLALADGGNDLVLVVVPEPGSMGLLAAAGLLLGLRRYRRNQFMAKGLKNVIHPYGKGF